MCTNIHPFSFPVSRSSNEHEHNFLQLFTYLYVSDLVHTIRNHEDGCVFARKFPRGIRLQDWIHAMNYG